MLGRVLEHKCQDMFAFGPHRHFKNGKHVMMVVSGAVRHTEEAGKCLCPFLWTLSKGPPSPQVPKSPTMQDAEPGASLGPGS